MSDILNVITFNTIRATAGMSLTDVSDEVLNDLSLQPEIEIDLQRWVPEYAQVLDDTWAEPKAGALAFVKPRLLAYLKYYSAALLCKAAPGLMLRRLSDGANIGQRFDSVDPSSLTPSLLLKAQEFKDEILEFMEGTTFEQVTLFSRVVPDYDPVVG